MFPSSALDKIFLFIALYRTNSLIKKPDLSVSLSVFCILFSRLISAFRFDATDMIIVGAYIDNYLSIRQHTVNMSNTLRTPEMHPQSALKNLLTQINSVANRSRRLRGDAIPASHSRILQI